MVFSRQSRIKLRKLELIQTINLLFEFWSDAMFRYNRVEWRQQRRNEGMFMERRRLQIVRRSIRLCQEKR